MQPVKKVPQKQVAGNSITSYFIVAGNNFMSNQRPPSATRTNQSNNQMGKTDQVAKGFNFNVTGTNGILLSLIPL